MKIRKTRNLLFFVAYPLGGFFGGYLGFTVHWSLVLLVFPYVALLQFLTSRIRCPNCNTPVGWHKYRIRNFTVAEWWSPITKRRCEHCGHEFE
jgi:hypothetical protein